MSRRKDRERFWAMKERNPDYLGFRGHDGEVVVDRKSPLQSIECSTCGKRRNIDRDVALSEGDNYVCLSCREEEPNPNEVDKE